MLRSTEKIKGLRVLVVEDEGLIAEEICDRLANAGCEIVASVDTGEGAIEAAAALRPDLILMDIRLKGEMDGITAAERIAETMRVPLIYLTAHSDQKTLQRARTTNAYGYVLKPFNIKALLVAIAAAVERVEMERRLEDNQLTYATILGSVSDAVIVTDRQGCIRFINPVGERLSGWTTAEAQGEPSGKVLTVSMAGDAAPTEEWIAMVLANQIPRTFGHHAEVIGRGGSRVPVEGNINPIVDSLGRVVGTSITIRNVTEARQAEAGLKAMAEQLRAVVDTAVDAVILFDEGGRVRMSNPACRRLFGYEQADLGARGLDDLLPSAWADILERIEQPPGGRVDPPVLLHGLATSALRRDGTRFPAELSVGEARQAGQAVYVAIVRDVSERRALEAALLDAVGNEQRRFASDLHDGLGQELTGLSLLLGALTRTADAEGSAFAGDLRRACDVVRGALDSCRNIARGLSPVAGPDRTLADALRDLVGRIKAASGPAVDLSVAEFSRIGLSAVATDHMYRIAQEALSNALKHARARVISVRLNVDSGSVLLEICDDGANAGATFQSLPGLGMGTMRYRASMIGARFEVARQGAMGTCIVCECPQAA